MKKNRILSILLAVSMTVTLAACGSGTPDLEKTTEAADGGETVTIQSEDSQKSVTYWIDPSVNSTAISNFDDTYNWQAIQENLGIDIIWQHPASGQASEQFNLMMTDDELPDIIYYNWSNYPGGSADAAIADGKIIALNDYMEYAPDLAEVLDENDIWRKSAMTAEGNIVGFPFIRGDDYLRTTAGLIIRKDWLDDLNLEMPQTPDELYQVLKAFKEKKGAEVPFTANTVWFVDYGIKQGMLTSPFGLAKGDFYQIDGTVHYGYAEEEYKGVLEYLNKLYEEGLLDPNFQTLDDNAVKANMMNGLAGVTVGNAGGYLGTMVQTMESDPDFDLAGFGPLVANDGDIPMCTNYEASLPGTFVIITPACQNKEAAVKFLNYGYTEEGNMLFNFGIEGVSYTIEDGKPVYTDLIMNNPEGLTKQLALAQYTRAWQNGPFVQDKEYYLQYADLPQQQDAVAKWSTSEASEYTLPPVTVAEADAAEYSKLSGDITTYISEMTIRYITGLESLDTFESGYLATLKSMGVDRLIELQQAALDEFNAR